MTMQGPVHVISLARSQDRRAAFARQNTGLDFRFVDAIEGASLTSDQVETFGFNAPGVKYSVGGMGCALSHLGLWEQAIAQNQPMLIAEDDAIFRHDFCERAQAVMRVLPPDWDMVLWGWNYDSVLVANTLPPTAEMVMAFDQTQLRRNVQQFQQMQQPACAMTLLHAFGLMAYSLSPKGARLLKQACFPLKPLALKIPLIPNDVRNTGIDSATNAHYRQLAAFVSFPPLVISRNEHESSTVQVA